MSDNPNNPKSAQFTSFTLDNMGRFLCNTAHEALTSAGINVNIGNPPPDARPFDVIIVGGGTFGSAIAQHIFFNDKTKSRRILVIERGPFVLPEHVQNLPFLGGLPNFVRPWEYTYSGDSPGLRICLGGRSLEWGGWSPELLEEELSAWPSEVVKALRKPVEVVDRPTSDPGYFQQAAEQLGTVDSNDFIFGPLHTALRQQLASGLKASGTKTLISKLPLSSWPHHPKVRYASTPPSDGELRELLGLEPSDPILSADEMKDLLKVEAPLAVQSRTDPGQFPSNKFSALPLLITAARTAGNESFPYDQLKRLMVVPGWHVQEVITETLPDKAVKVTGVKIVRGPNDTETESLVVPLATNGVVILAQGTVETTRLAIQTFRESLKEGAAKNMGKNLVAHLRSNLTIRVPRSSIPGLPAEPSPLQTSALFVKGKVNVAGSDGVSKDRYFHLQITASGLPAGGTLSEAELFRKIPDLDNFEDLQRSDDKTVVITLRGIGEMAPGNPESVITVPQDAGSPQDFNRPKAKVALGDSKVYTEKLAAGQTPTVSEETKIDAEVWKAMDELTDEVALIFGAGKRFEILTGGGGVIDVPEGATVSDLKSLLPYEKRRDGLGTTHHDGGTLRMGDSGDESVTDGFGRIRGTTNCFCAGPMLFPTAGSPNPMLTGVALARRTADYLSYRFKSPDPGGLLASPKKFAGDGADWQVLFDGTTESFKRWRRIGSNNGSDNQPACDFKYVDGQIVTVGAGDFALLWYEPEPFSNFILKLQFRVFDSGANSGIFVRFRDPRKELPEPIKSRAQADLDKYQNRAWTAVHSGFEIQIDDSAAQDKNCTGAIYDIPVVASLPATPVPGQQVQTFNKGPDLLARPWEDQSGWYEYEISVKGNDYEVKLGTVGGTKKTVSKFVNTDAPRALPASATTNPNDPRSGYIGLQAYGNSRVAFRNIQIKKTAP